MNRSRQSLALNIGSRVAVYWSDDDAWYEGTVASELIHDDDRLLVEYDDGETNWMDITVDKWYTPDSFTKHDTVFLALKQKKVAKLNVGSRISIWWPQEKRYYTGTITKIDDDSNNPHLVCYDDGEEEWISLLRRKFKRVPAKAERLHVGSRVSVYKEEHDQHFIATITKIKPHKSRPHQVKFVDESQGIEWLNLNVDPFLVIDPVMPQSSTSTAIVAGTGRPTGTLLPCTKATASHLKKRKWELLDTQPSTNSINACITRQQNQTKDKEEVAQTTKETKDKEEVAQTTKETKDKEEEDAQTTKKVCEEICVICKARAKHPQAMSCHHIFCKGCIKNHDSQQQHMVATCPLCKIAIVSKGVKYDPDHVSFKAVEALNRSMTEVFHTFSSASAASLESPLKLVPSCIVEACQSKQRNSRKYQGFNWRFQGCKRRFLRNSESINDAIVIEQVDAETGRIIETFSSTQKAFEKTKVSQDDIKRVLERRSLIRRGKATAGGFFWRFQGETHGPWSDPESSNLDPVEQLDFETGDVLQLYVSLAAANRALGLRVNSGCIRDVCDGKGRATAHGYFWRWKGSQAIPIHMIGVQKILQIRNTKNGKVVKEFRTSRDVQTHFGQQHCWNNLCRYSREKKYYKGYYWQYRMLKEPKSAGETMVGKRLRVLRPGSHFEWLEGKIEAFHSETGNHEIRLANGTVEQRKLEDIRYEWKDDQGEKHVEQLDLETGEVLATFDSISSAAASIPGSRRNRIVVVCQGRRKSSYGFFWRYKSSDAPLPPGAGKLKKKVEQLCLKTDRVVGTFESISAAAKAIGINFSGISMCCNGRPGAKTAGGFGWRFVKVAGEAMVGNEDDQGQKPIEQLDMKTGEVLATFDSISDAAASMPGSSRRDRIVLACRGRRKSSFGFFWRYKGSIARPPNLKGIKRNVEQLCLKTGRVVATFDTIADAARSIGISYPGLRQCCHGRAGAKSTGGFGWRFVKISGEAMVGKENDQGQKPVEQLDMKTGEVLATFDSISSAAASIPGCRRENIVLVCQGLQKSSFGFFWRYKGSDAPLLPNQKGVKRNVEQLCLKTGRVLATFDTLIAAARFIGISYPGISDCCNGRPGVKSAGGFGWRFVKISGEAMVGKENDQGQKPVEQLDMKTREVLATFDSISSAAASIPGGRRENIDLVCKGLRKSSSGFFWRYTGSNAPLLPNQKKGKTKR